MLRKNIPGQDQGKRMWITEDHTIPGPDPDLDPGTEGAIVTVTGPDLGMADITGPDPGTTMVDTTDPVIDTTDPDLGIDTIDPDLGTGTTDPDPGRGTRTGHTRIDIPGQAFQGSCQKPEVSS